MDHKTRGATVTATEQDLGQFTAIAAAWTVDRDHEQIRRGAFSKTIQRWKASGRQVPVHWAHKGEAENVIGSIDPAAMVERQDGLYVEGTLDLEDSDVAREAWRSMKAHRVALSFGFVVNDEFKRSDGIRELREIDLFEISVVPAPANENTRFLSLKSPVAIDPDWDPVPTDEEIRQRAMELEIEAIASKAAKARSVRVETFEC